MYFQYRRGKSILFYDSKDYEYFSSSAHVDVDVQCDEIAVPLYFPYHTIPIADVTTSILGCSEM